MIFGVIKTVTQKSKAGLNNNSKNGSFMKKIVRETCTSGDSIPESEICYQKCLSHCSSPIQSLNGWLSQP